MITITPFKDEFCQKIHTIYSINNDDPKHASSSVTTSEVCPRCKTRNFFRFYEPKREYETDEAYISVYDCKCPVCGKEFEFKDEFEKED